MNFIDHLSEKEKIKLIQDYNVWDEDPDTGNKHLILPNLSELIFNEFNLNFITIIDTKQIYFFNGKYFDSHGESIIKQIAEQLLQEYTKEYNKREIVGYIRDKNYQIRGIFNPPKHLINLLNGVYDITKGELLPHSAKYHFLTLIPVNYDPGAKSNGFEKVLQDICSQQGKRRIEIEKTIQEYIGYSIYSSYPFKAYVVLDGCGDNGKTTLVDIVLELIGKRNNTSVPLQELNSRPFTKSKLFGKLTNISDDLPKKGLKYTGVIKQITGNSPMWADIKNHKDGIEFINIAKPWYTCNELPETEDITDAFFSRQLPITLLNKYVHKNSPEIDNITVFEANPDLVSKLTTSKQLSGLLNFALKGLRRLLKNKHFSMIQTTDEKRETWLRKTNPVHSFIDDDIETTNEDWVITVDDFFDEIVQYCADNGFDKLTRHKVTSKMKDEGIKKQQKKIKEQPRVWCWVGIRSSTNTLINYYIGQRNEKNIDFFERITDEK